MTVYLMAKVLNIKDFSIFPGPRFEKLGESSGEDFRDNWLIPELKKDDVSVNLDGVFGYGSSFLEEVFGGLVRAGLPKERILYVRDNLRSDEDPTLIKEIQEYMDEALKANSFK